MNRFRNTQWRFTAVLVAAVALASLLVAASQLGARDGKASASADPVAPAAAKAPSLFTGIEQHGPALGSPEAPLTLVEYADLQCPYCAHWAREALPTLVRDYVRPGKLRVVFRGLAFIGPDSDKALSTALAAGADDHLWDVVHELYEHQAGENAGWVTDELVTEIAAGIPGLDARRLLDGRWEGGVEPELKRAAAAARAAGVNGTPSFQLGPTGGRLELVNVSSLGPEGIVPAVEAVLGR